MWVVLLIGVGLVWLVLCQVGKHIIFRAQKKRWPMHLAFEEISFQTPENKTLTGVYLKAHPGKETLLFFHGRGGNISHFESFAQTYSALGYGIFMFDYEGFGTSSGTPSQKALFEDALCAARYGLNHLKLHPHEVVLYGHSLGNSPALFAANRLNFPFKALILQSPFLSTPDMAVCLWTHTYHPRTLFYKLTRAFVCPFLYKNRFDNTRQTDRLKIPVLVCMSREDKIIPWQMTLAFADNSGLPNRFISPTGGHDEFAWAAQAVKTFLEKL